MFEPMDGKVATARGLLASNEFKCEPWGIYVSKRRGGGYHVKLQGGLTYSEKYRAGIEEAIRQNRALLCQVLGIEDRCLLMPHQVHLTEVVAIDEAFLNLSADEQQQRLEQLLLL